MHSKKVVLTFLKLVIPAGLFIYLLWSVDPEDYRIFWQQPKRWHLLFAAQLLALAAVVMSFLRWRALVLAFDIPFSVGEALRLGFLGYMLNFVSFGSVGGDLFKAILVARDKPRRRPEAVASVLLDRAIGLLGLVLLAWLGLQFLPRQSPPAVLVGIRRGAGAVAIVAIGALLVAIYAGPWFDRLIGVLERLPLLGLSVARMARAVRLLRTKPLTLVGMLACSVTIHAMIATCIFLVSNGVYAETPTYLQHLMIVPPAMAAGTLPLAPGGLGYQEGALAALFGLLPDLPEGFSAILVATIYRLLTISIAGIGLVFYWTSHGREFKFAGEVEADLPVQAKQSFQTENGPAGSAGGPAEVAARGREA